MIYNTTATPEWVRSMNPDALVIAVGAEPVCPPIPGIEKAQEATSFYTRMDEIGQRVAIIGGGTIGAELALTLAETGRDVTVIEMNDELAAQGHFFYKIGLKHAILDVKENYHALLKTRCLEVLDNGVRAVSYTHLDVYKRQPACRGLQLLCHGRHVYSDGCAERRRRCQAGVRLFDHRSVDACRVRLCRGRRLRPLCAVAQLPVRLVLFHRDCLAALSVGQVEKNYDYRKGVGA